MIEQNPALATHLLFEPLWQDAKDDFAKLLKERPLLSHYTSMATLEQILKNDELWFSNPLLMNDHEEVKFGIREGVSGAKLSSEIGLALGTPARHQRFLDAIDGYFAKYDREVFDNYVLCLTRHDFGNTDGLLSMWRGYGGNGSGAAIVFDTKLIVEKPDRQILIISQVHYGSKDERIQWLKNLFSRFALILAAHPIPDDLLYICAHALFERIKLFSLFSKDHGFKEEREYRALYLPERDVSARLKPMLGYVVSRNGIEPKLKLKLGPASSDLDMQRPLDEWIHSIILGPTVSSYLAVRSVQRMLELIGKPKLVNRLFASTIPLRAQ